MSPPRAASRESLLTCCQESYLFRAACSELRTEIQNNRRAAADQMRNERGQLQYEFDALQQRVNHETIMLKDDLKGRFDDRKMAVQMEMRAMNSRIQELNYKITVALVGEGKGQVEALRWFLTRRAAILISSMASKSSSRLLWKGGADSECSINTHLVEVCGTHEPCPGARAKEDGGAGWHQWGRRRRQTIHHTLGEHRHANWR
jgi:hypothetical protein